jgi:hypothetical protein
VLSDGSDHPNICKNQTKCYDKEHNRLGQPLNIFLIYACLVMVGFHFRTIPASAVNIILTFDNEKDYPGNKSRLYNYKTPSHDL